MTVASRGNKPITCSKCGFVGGNARGCGTAHVTRARPALPGPTDPGAPRPRTLHATPAALNFAKQRIARRFGSLGDSPPQDDDGPWSSQRIADERELAENRKHDGALPRPHSTFRVTHGAGGGFGEVEELEVDSEAR